MFYFSHYLAFLGAPDESIHSNYSEEKFHSSLTEDELKHDFRQVLPSENHRRKSLDHRDYIISGNETSSVSFQSNTTFINFYLLWCQYQANVFIT